MTRLDDGIDTPPEVWSCDWTPDELNPLEDGCPYCADRMCARFDGLNCTHDRIERHGYRPGEAIR